MLPMLKFVWQHFVIILLSLIIISTYFNWGGLFIMAALLCNEPLVRWLSQTTPNPAIVLETNHTHTTHHAQTNNVNHNQPPCISLLLPSIQRYWWNDAPLHPPQHPPHIAEVVGRDKWWNEWSETDDSNEERFERLFNFNLLDLLDVRSEQMPLEFFSAWVNAQRAMHVQFAVHAAYSCAFSWWIFCLLWTMDPLHVQIQWAQQVPT